MKTEFIVNLFVFGLLRMKASERKFPAVKRSLRKFIFASGSILAVATAVRADNTTGVSKQEIYLQTSTSAPTIPALQYPFVFSATSASSAATVTPPGFSA